jgi:hypothetical protein
MPALVHPPDDFRFASHRGLNLNVDVSEIPILCFLYARGQPGVAMYSR